jgi:putative ABC transport system substrate-binding protein
MEKRVKQSAAVLMVMAFSLLMIVPLAVGAEKKIGILLWSDEPRYADSKNGIIEGLKQDGFAADAARAETISAVGNKGKVTELSKKMAAGGYDLVIAIGTSAAVPLAKEVKDIPLVFSMVYDPITSKIANAWESSGNNTTGASSMVPMSIIVDNLKKIAAVKRIGALYTPGEKNSEIQLKDLQALQETAGIKVTPVPLSKKEDIGTILPEAVGGVDAFLLTGSAIVGENVAAIVDIASKSRVITVSHLDDLAEKGVLLAVSASPYQQGLLAGGKAAKILKGAKPASLPIETLKNLDVIINMKTAAAARITVPPDYLKTATRVIK